MKCVLSDKLIREFKLEPTARRAELCDEMVKQLYAEIRATSPGEATFYIRYKDQSGKTCHKKIGRTDEIDVAGRWRDGEPKTGVSPGGSRDPARAVILKQN